MLDFPNHLQQILYRDPYNLFQLSSDYLNKVFLYLLERVLLLPEIDNNVEVDLDYFHIFHQLVF